MFYALSTLLSVSTLTGECHIHRSYIIALDQIKAVTRNTVQIGEETLTVSDPYKETFNQFLSRWTN